MFRCWKHSLARRVVMKAVHATWNPDCNSAILVILGERKQFPLGLLLHRPPCEWRAVTLPQSRLGRMVN